MKLILKLLVYVCTIYDISSSEWISVGASHSFKCETTDPLISQITWQIIKPSDTAFSSLFLCNVIDTPHCVPNVDSSLEFYKATLTSETSKFRGILTIISVAPHDSSNIWTCEIISASTKPQSTVFKISVYAIPETPTCEPVVLFNESSIKLKCGTEKILPEAICIFYVKSNNTEQSALINGSVIYKSGPSNISGYNKTECTYIVPGDTIGPGLHIFSVVMFPNISLDVTKTRSNSVSVKIGYPMASLASDCLLQYIVKNETRTCTCQDGNSHLFPSRVVWYSDGGVFNAIDGKLEFNVSSLGKKEFTCIVTNKLNWTHQIDYSPEVVYELLEKQGNETAILWAVGVGVSVGLILLITLTGLSVLHGYCPFKKNSRDKYEKFVDNTPLYNRKEKVFSDNGRTLDYKNIITTIMSATEPPKNLKHAG